MNKSNWRYLVDTLLFICFTGLTTTGLLMAFVLGEGPASTGARKYFLNLHLHQWSHIHLYISITLIALIIIHLLLSWKWIKSQARKLFPKGWNAVLLTTLGVAIVVPFLFWIFSQKNSEAYENFGARSEERPRRQLSGRLEQQTTALKPLAEKESIASKHPSALQQQTAQEKTASQRKMAPTVSHEHSQDSLVKGRMEEGISGILITGQMTLVEISEKTGISIRQITEAMKLPANIPGNETLGRLRRGYGFNIQDFRDTLASLMEKK